MSISRIGIRSEVLRILYPLGIPDHLDGRIVLRGQTDVRVRGIVHEHDVVARSVLLYQIVFQDEGFLLTAGYDVVKVSDIGDHLGGLVVVGAGKILGYAVFQFLGLADVDYFPMAVLHQITAR